MCIGCEEDGNPLALGARQTEFDSRAPDVAKYNEGNDVRLTKRISFNTTHLKPNTLGVIKRVDKKAFGGSQYYVRFRGVDFDIIVPEKHLDLLAQGQ